MKNGPILDTDVPIDDKHCEFAIQRQMKHWAPKFLTSLGFGLGKINRNRLAICNKTNHHQKT